MVQKKSNGYHIFANNGNWEKRFGTPLLLPVSQAVLISSIKPISSSWLSLNKCYHTGTKTYRSAKTTRTLTLGVMNSSEFSSIVHSNNPNKITLTFKKSTTHQGSNSINFYSSSSSAYFNSKFKSSDLIFSSLSLAKYQVFRVQADKNTKSTFQLNCCRCFCIHTVFLGRHWINK